MPSKVPTIVGVASTTVELGLRRPKPTATTPGLTESIGELWKAHGDGIETGIWEANPGRFTATRDGYHEICQILTGRATLFPDGGEPIEISAGDTLVTPAGWTGSWIIHETVRKLYVTVEIRA